MSAGCAKPWLPWLFVCSCQKKVKPGQVVGSLPGHAWVGWEQASGSLGVPQRQFHLSAPSRQPAWPNAGWCASQTKDSQPYVTWCSTGHVMSSGSRAWDSFVVPSGAVSPDPGFAPTPQPSEFGSSRIAKYKALGSAAGSTDSRKLNPRPRTPPQAPSHATHPPPPRARPLVISYVNSFFFSTTILSNPPLTDRWASKPLKYSEFTWFLEMHYMFIGLVGSIRMYFPSPPLTAGWEAGWEDGLTGPGRTRGGAGAMGSDTAGCEL